MATANPPRFVVEQLVNSVANDFQAHNNIAVTVDGRNELVRPAVPHRDRVESELRTGEITYDVLKEAITVVLRNAYDIALEEHRDTIDSCSIRKSMEKYCPYIMWC